MSRASFFADLTALAVSMSSSIPNVCERNLDILIGDLPSLITTSASSSSEETSVDVAMASSSSKVRRQISALLDKDPSLAGPLLRLAFHDAATWESTPSRPQGKSSSAIVTSTGGSNGSIRFELDWPQNRGLRRPLEIVTSIRKRQTKTSTAVDSSRLDLSLADVIAIAGAEAVSHAGGPPIPIKLGRVDSTLGDPQQLRTMLRKDTERSVVETTLPSPALDSDGLRLFFGRLGLSNEQFVALSGAHGLGRHVSLLGMPKACLRNLTRTCLDEAPVLLPFVAAEVDSFDNTYFTALLRWYDRDVKLGEVAFIPTDVALVVDKDLRQHVERFANDKEYFFRVFTSAYQTIVENTVANMTGRY